VRFVDLAFSAFQLALAIVSLSRVRRTKVARPIALFCLCMATWSGAAFAGEISGVQAWQLVDRAVSPLTAPLALDIALTFDGRRRALRSSLKIAYALGGTLGAVSLAALVAPALRPFIGSQPWIVLLYSLSIPLIGFSIIAFVAHLQRSVDRLEEERTRSVLVAVGIAAVLGSIEPFAPNVSSLGKLGLALATLTIVLVSLQFSWFENDLRVRRFTYVLALLGAGTAVYIALFGFRDAMALRLVLGTIFVTIPLVVTSRRWAEESALRKEKVSQLATLGRFSAQIAHDIKNPLAALKGAGQLLRDDAAAWPANAAAPAGPKPVELVDLMLEEIDRISRVVDAYGRMARVDVTLAPTDVNEVVTKVVSLQALARSSTVRLSTKLAEGLPCCNADGDMLGSVIENLVRNAIEASRAGGSVTVLTEAAPDGIVVRVEDDGVGMDAQTRERAFDDFFTTKTTGSGLGLAFVQRVVQAHGGEVSLTSTPGHGTVVRVRLPG
jgi:two-component system, NtrC family, sensor histidine kinase HydH